MVAELAFGRDRIVVSTLRCGRNNPGSNPGHGMTVSCYGMRAYFFFLRPLKKIECIP